MEELFFTVINLNVNLNSYVWIFQLATNYFWDMVWSFTEQNYTESFLSWLIELGDPRHPQEPNRKGDAECYSASCSQIQAKFRKLFWPMCLLLRLFFQHGPWVAIILPKIHFIVKWISLFYLEVFPSALPRPSRLPSLLLLLLYLSPLFLKKTSTLHLIVS